MMNKIKVGDRFYSHKNMTDSETIKIGFKGVIDDVIHCDWGDLYCCTGYGFTANEIKPLITVKA